MIEIPEVPCFRKSVVDMALAKGKAVRAFVNRIKKDSQSVDGFIDANMDKFWCNKGITYYCDMVIFDEQKNLDEYFKGGE